MKTNQTIAATVLVATTLLAGCASPGYQSTSSQPYPASSQSYSTSYGVVDSIQMVNTNNGNGNGGIGAGTVVGGVVGGLLGNQVGAGNGRTAATAAGVVGGALVGNQIEQRNRTQTAMYQVGVRLDNGSFQTVTQDSVADIGVGNRVRIENGRAYRY